MDSSIPRRRRAKLTAITPRDREVSKRRRRSSYRVRPAWLSTKKIVAMAIMIPVVGASVFGVRLVYSLAHLTHQSPLAVLHDLVAGGAGSLVHQDVVDLKRINIAFYGYGGAGHDGSYLSDSIMVVSIQPQASGPPEVTELSVPRDWLVPINFGTSAAPRIHSAKINEAYADGMSGESKQFGNSPLAGGELADQTLENLLGIHIDHFVGIDFYAFKDAVDSVGGVDITVQNAFTDYQYPAGECNGTRYENCAVETVSFTAGPQHMNGARALIYARSRHAVNGGEGSDFARSKRQQLVVAALKQKVVSVGGIGNLPNLLNALGDHAITDLTVSDVEALYSVVKDVDPATVEHVSVDDTNFLYACGYPYNCGAYYLYAHDNTYQTLHSFVGKFFVPPSVTSAHVSVTFDDASGLGKDAGLRWKNVMAELGLTTADGGKAPRALQTQVINTGGQADAATAHWLADYFGVSVTTPPAASATPSGAGVATKPAAMPGVTVIVGISEESNFNNRSGNGD
jgi:LCP family protein required for cell wall assembly